MKRESIMMLIAGLILGAVLTFMGTREYYRRTVDNTHQAPETVAKASPDQPGKASFDPARHEAMLEAMKKDIREHPDDVRKRIMLANIYYDAGKFGEAVPLYEESLEKNPGNTNIMVDLGTCYRKLGRADDALTMFDRALKIEPDKKQALFNKAIVLGMDKGDRKGAKKILETLKKRYPDEPAVEQLRHFLQQKWNAESPKEKNG